MASAVNSGYLCGLSEWQGQVGDIRSRGIHTPHRSVFISAVASICASIQSPRHRVAPAQISLWQAHACGYDSVPDQPELAETRYVCQCVMPVLGRLFSLFQIKACKESWDARCPRGAPRCLCAAAQDQIKMKITQFGLVLWAGSSGPAKRRSSIDTRAEPRAHTAPGAAVYSGTRCG